MCRIWWTKLFCHIPVRSSKKWSAGPEQIVWRYLGHRVCFLALLDSALWTQRQGAFRWFSGRIWCIMEHQLPFRRFRVPWFRCLDIVNYWSVSCFTAWLCQFLWKRLARQAEARTPDNFEDHERKEIFPAASSQGMEGKGKVVTGIDYCLPLKGVLMER